MTGCPRLCVIVGAVAAAGGFVRAGDGPNVLMDPAGDAVVRRTDAGNDGPVHPGGVLPDLISMELAPWPAPSPGNADPDVFRMTVVFQGLVNPPGPLGLGGLPYDPFRFGPSPVFGFVELDIDRDRDTGGEFGGPENTRYLANVGRFGEVPYGSLGNRAAFDGTDLDGNFDTQPFVERSGQDFALVFCGCFDVEVIDSFGDSDGTFDAGDTWDVSGRFFQRAGGYEEASAAFGGSFFGLYDPIVTLRFSHHAGADQTTITLRFPLTMAGAAMLTGEPEQAIDLDVSNHVSIVEALRDIIDGAEGILTGPTFTLTRRWRGRDPVDYIDPTRWDITALVGTAYPLPDPGGALYVWTDAAGDHRRGDFDRSGAIDQFDVDMWDSALAARDGGASDSDGMVNGAVVLLNPGPNFSVYDLDGDGVIGPADRALLVPVLPGDANGDCRVNFADVTSVLTHWGTVYPPGGPPGPGDADHDGVVAFADVTAVLTGWGSMCP